MNGKIRTLAFLSFTASAGMLSGCNTDSSDSCAVYRYVSVDWSIESPSTKAVLTCDAVQAQSVRLEFGSNTYTFPCSDGGNGGAPTPAGIPVGSYLSSMQLLSTSNTVLADTAAPPGGPTTYTMAECTPTFIPPVTFDVGP